MAVNVPIDPRTIMHVVLMIIWLAHWTGTMSFSIDVLRHFPPALSYFLKDKCPRNTVSWSVAKSGQIPKVIFHWAFLIRFTESFGIIRHFGSNRKTLFDKVALFSCCHSELQWVSLSTANSLRCDLSMKIMANAWGKKSDWMGLSEFKKFD